MTNEEAVKYAKDTSFCCGCPIDMSIEGNSEKCNECEHRQFFEMAISALEKQIPKKVTSGIDRTWGKETIEPVCPSCDYFLPRFQFIGKGKRVAYCEHCGQAIDWTEDGDDHAKD